MPRKHAGGWHWNHDDHIRALADCLRRELRAHQIATELNEKFRPAFPEMTLCPNSIVSALRNKSVPEHLRKLFPDEAEGLIAQFKKHKPGPGRPKGSGGSRPGRRKVALPRTAIGSLGSSRPR